MILLPRIVNDYCAATMAGEDAVMITLRRADARDLNRRARAWFDDAGQLRSDRVEIAAGEFAMGDLVVLKRNDRRFGVENDLTGGVCDVVDSRRPGRVRQQSHIAVDRLPSDLRIRRRSMSCQSN